MWQLPTFINFIVNPWWNFQRVYCNLRCGVRVLAVDDNVLPHLPQTNTSYSEAVIFWSALIVSPVLWILCFFTALIGFKWTWAVSVMHVCEYNT